jgi:PEGA domain
VVVDGKTRGVSPPVRALDLAPGPHTIEIKNANFPVHVERVQLKAGESVRIRHRFK